jgi:hypothetical protein
MAYFSDFYCDITFGRFSVLFRVSSHLSGFQVILYQMKVFSLVGKLTVPEKLIPSGSEFIDDNTIES